MSPSTANVTEAVAPYKETTRYHQSRIGEFGEEAGAPTVACSSRKRSYGTIKTQGEEGTQRLKPLYAVVTNAPMVNEREHDVVERK